MTPYLLAFAAIWLLGGISCLERFHKLRQGYRYPYRRQEIIDYVICLISGPIGLYAVKWMERRKAAQQAGGASR